MTLLATAGDPAVAAAIRRVTERRVSCMAGMFEELGLTPARAGRTP
jgi:hypothetical protein